MAGRTEERTGAGPHVVIVGAGFGGLTAARTLARAPATITIIDRCNHHLFQPLLYQVATAGLSPADIAAPIRHILRRQANARVVLGEVTGVDTAAKQVALKDRVVPYDYLILATGADHDYFGHNWERCAPGLKTVEDATAIRARILLAFEQAEMSEDPKERERLLTFVVVGGGPTGVEMAGAIAELAKRALAGDFRFIDPRAARIVLLEGGPRVLGAFPERLSAYARRALERLGVDVITDRMVNKIGTASVTTDAGALPTRTVIWAAGVRASPAAQWLGAESDRAGRVKVEPDLTAAGLPDVYVVGDTAAVFYGGGKPVPGIAPAAKQMGRHAARLIAARIAGKPESRPFRYRNDGNLATIGRSSAVIDFGRVRMTGYLAWLVWGVAHIFFLIGFRNKAAVMLEWSWAYITFKKGMRLITRASR